MPYNQYEKNQDFNTYLDRNWGEVRIGTFSEAASFMLFNYDETSYIEQLNEWISRKQQSLRLTYDKLLQIKTNLSRLQQLENAITNGSLTPVVGAGLSAPSGHPTWTTFLRDTARNLEMDLNIIDQKINAGLHEEIASSFIDKMNIEWFNEQIEHNFSLKSYPQGAIQQLPNLDPACIITTNFDKNIETIFESSRKSFDHILLSDKLMGFGRRLSQSTRILIKIHGDHLEPYNRILTKEEYDASYGHGPIDLDLNLPKTLAQIYKTRTLLFLGCSLMADRTMKVFNRVKSDSTSEQEIPRHYTFEQLPTNSNHTLKRERELIDHMIFPIWYPRGEHQHIESALAHLSEVFRTKNRNLGTSHTTTLTPQT
ncbi:hypothetical protein FRC98_05735 [Lujinxingia vulgaris]|uniref:Uncharacterized protein n=1 Tax=Lujinxingia vulgaris TaxID=2600176 RepID=A0A5C6XEZ9_9DELT|nr:SIR2 family protein [Lujinxingia vulgaris]TXD38389.1 hypothetical protein FRC98_05735 [Lujinxingia vulgaris]